MAKAKGKGKGHALPKDALEAPSTVKAAPTEQPAPSGATAIKEVFVTVGGKQDKPVKENVALVPVVKASELINYGMSKRDITIRLAKNILAGVTFEKEVVNKENAQVWITALRMEKRDFFYILEHLKMGEPLQAWNASLANRKRYDQPTIQSLGKACRAWIVSQGRVDPRKSPMEVFAASCLVILRNPQISAEERIRQVVAMLAQKAGESVEEVQQAKAA